MSQDVVIQVAYLVAAALFILGLKGLSSPATARRGNTTAALGMLLAVVVTLWYRGVVNYAMIFAGIAIGSAAGAVLAYKIRMTAMPQMVGLLNGLGGAASAFVAAAEFLRLSTQQPVFPRGEALSIGLGALIGCVTLTGSVIAFGKLQELVSGRPILFPFRNVVNGGLFLAIIGMAVYLVVSPEGAYAPAAFWGLFAASLLLGILLVIPIGGADMPVVISLLNSYSGLAASMAGFILNNTVLIVSGALVGAAGLILTQIMSKAMNRSLTNIVFGGFGAVQGGGTGGGPQGDKAARAGTAADAATMLAYARSVIFVPGYGLAVAQAQHAAAELASNLEKRGVDVKFAIHPVAGRMPGHMNVLLAEANVPYDKLYDLDQVNREFEHTDVAVVVGANDVTNPDARNVSNSPIYGMPILDVDKARSTIVIKRSLAPGFAGIDNPLFYAEKTMMVFMDAKKGLADIITEMKGL